MIAMVSEMEDATPFGLGCTLAEGREQIQNVYAVRKRSVGLLGNVQGEKRPIAFVEDTAVPPEHLATSSGSARERRQTIGVGISSSN